MKTAIGSGVVSTAGALAAAAGLTTGAAVVVDNEQTEKVKVALAGGKTVEAVVEPVKAVAVKKVATAKKVTKKAAVATEKPAEPKAEAKVETEESKKKIAARKYFDAHKQDKDGKAAAAGTIAGGMAKEMKISYSNAYYYVTRVFGLKSKKAK